MDPSSSSSSLVPYSPSSSSYKRKRDDEPFNCCKRPKHDVFLSYSNEDIGKSFVSHLKGSLERNGFDISDHTSLPIGQDESSEVLKAIEDSGIYVVVFSSKYPFSVKCLDELVLIMESLLPESKKRRVFPIFFKVDPSHVRSQEDASFLEAFQTHRDNNVDGQTVAKWRQALQYVGKKAGEHLKTGENEEEFVRKIVKMLGKLKLPLELFDADHRVGIEPRAQELISKLRLGDPDPSITAVLGMSGSGKTTLVKAVYDRIVADFDANCFIENIRYYKHNGPNWKVVLQHDVISRFTGDDYRIHNVVASNIRNFVSTRKVLLVLDDVDKYEQLQALGIHHHASFGLGSRILVTTTNKQSLSNLPYSRYDISLLNEWESSELFTGLAYEKGQSVDKKFVDEIVYRAGGVPLVLEVWGRYFKSHERQQWPRLLEKLRRIPHEDVQKKLQVSYDSLSPSAKNLFLDIACFFDGMEKDLVIKVLQDEDNAFFPDIEIQDLMDKGLVKEDVLLSMHAVIREMGREVVRQENEDDPGQRSRLVGLKDVVRVLRDCSGTDSIRSINLDWDFLKEKVTHVQVEAFRKMSNLRFIKLNKEIHPPWSYSCSNDDMSPFSFKHLKHLEWLGFPFRCLDKFDMGNVVVIRLFQSELEILWEGAFKSLKKLRILAVSYSSYLTRTGSFIGLENLEELQLYGCENLEELDSSIGCLQKLVTLDLRRCKQLKRVPWKMIGKLTSLVTLDLRESPNILNISHELGNLKSLKYLYLKENSFPSLPDSLCQLHQLSEIELSGCASLKSIPNLPPNIEHVIARDCSSLVSLPDSLCQLHQLSEIELSGCANLKSIPNLPPNIEHVIARDCSSLVSLPSNMAELQFLSNLVLDNCEELGSEGFVKVTGLRNLEKLSMINCNVSQVSSEIGNLVSLVELKLSGNTFPSLPDSISNLSQLEFLKINGCHKLKLLPLLPSKLRTIAACGCGSLDVMPFDSTQMGYIFRSQWCRQLLVNSQLEPSFTRDLIINLSGKEVPEWCSYTSIGGKELSFVAPTTTTQLDKKICGVIFYCHCHYFSLITMLNKTKGTSHQFRLLGSDFSDDFLVGMGLYPLNDETLIVEAGDTLLIQDSNVRGLSLIYEDDVVDNSAIFLKDVKPTTLNNEVCIFPWPAQVYWWVS